MHLEVHLRKYPFTGMSYAKFNANHRIWHIFSSIFDEFLRFHEELSICQLQNKTFSILQCCKYSETGQSHTGNLETETIRAVTLPLKNIFRHRAMGQSAAANTQPPVRERTASLATQRVCMLAMIQERERAGAGGLTLECGFWQSSPWIFAVTRTDCSKSPKHQRSSKAKAAHSCLRLSSQFTC